MPSPVQFNISLAPLPVNFSGTPQQWATALVDRLTVEPQEPWNSFLTGDTLPTSDNGPVLYQNKEWRVFDTATGAYTYHRQNGAGLINGTVPLAKLSPSTPGGLVRFNSTSGVPEVIAPATPGQVLTLSGTTPTWANTYVPGSTFFEACLDVGAPQSINTDGNAHKVLFTRLPRPTTAAFDTGLNRVSVTRGSVWFFYVALQVEDTSAASTDVQLITLMRLNGSVIGPGAVTNYTTAQSRFSVYTGGMVYIETDGYVDVSVTGTENTPSATGLQIADNDNNTRFGGFRIL